MALPYATEDQLNRVKKELENKIGTGGGETPEIPTKLSELTNDTGFITTAALTDYALKSELPDLSSYALKTELPDLSEYVTVDTLSTYALKTELPDVSNLATKEEVTDVEDKIPDITPLATKEEVEKIAIKEEGAAIQVGDEEHELNIKTSGRFTVNSAHEVVTYDPYPGDGTRKILPLENNDSISGKKTTGDGVPLIFMSKWDKVEVGGNGAPLNLNGSADRVTYKDDKELAFVDDLEWIPVICNMNFRTLSDKVYTQDEIFAWFFVKDIFELKDTIIKHPIYLRYGISLSTNPMYYYIPCQYVAFTDANTVEMITDGLDTKNDKFSRYHITIKLDGTVIKGASNIKVELKENVFVPELPEDADTKTYQLKAVNGTLTWVE